MKSLDRLKPKRMTFQAGDSFSMNACLHSAKLDFYSVQNSTIEIKNLVRMAAILIITNKYFYPDQEYQEGYAQPTADASTAPF
jgi:hypothetical protein